MAKKHQYVISAKATRSKAQRSWRRKAKNSLKDTPVIKTSADTVPPEVAVRMSNKVKKRRMKKLRKRHGHYLATGPIVTFTKPKKKV